MIAGRRSVIVSSSPKCWRLLLPWPVVWHLAAKLVGSQIWSLAHEVVGDVSFAFKGGTETFINKGTNGRWKDVLSEEELQMYRDAMARTLDPGCAEWLENGGPVK